ncbi:transposase [Streptomyces mexicanus]
MDNLSAHTGAGIRRWAKENKVELCFTPTYASWADPIEAQFGPLRQLTVANSHHRSHLAPAQALHRQLRWLHINARHPDVLTAQRKERARVRSERGIQREGHPLGRTPPQRRSLTDREPQPPSAEGGRFRRRTATEGRLRRRKVRSPPQRR